MQRSRRKGVMVPEGTIYVGRPTMWGNPFANRQWAHARSCILHSRWIDGGIGALTLENMGFSPGEIDALERLRIRVVTRLHQLSGMNLACWCPLTSQWCHADTLLRLAPVYADYERCSN